MKLLFEDIIVIDKEYLAYLQSFDRRVMTNHANSKERPNVAVLIDASGQKWAVPLSHSLSRRGGSKMASLDIFDNVNHRHLGHMKFNNMIPLAEGTYNTAFGKNDFKYDTLLNVQRNFIIDNFETKVVPRIKDAFRMHTINKSKDLNRGVMKIYNNFSLLETKSKEWQTVVNIEKGIRGFLALEPPKEAEVYNILEKVFKNKPSQDVLEFKTDTKEYFTKLYNHYKYKDAAKKKVQEVIHLEETGQIKSSSNSKDSGRGKRNDGFYSE